MVQNIVQWHKYAYVCPEPGVFVIFCLLFPFSPFQKKAAPVWLDGVSGIVYFVTSNFSLWAREKAKVSLKIKLCSFIFPFRTLDNILMWTVWPDMICCFVEHSLRCIRGYWKLLSQSICPWQVRNSGLKNDARHRVFHPEFNRYRMELSPECNSYRKWRE